MSQHHSSELDRAEAPAERLPEATQQDDLSDEEDDVDGTENTHLLGDTSQSRDYDGDESPAASSLRSLRNWGSTKKGKWRWPSIIALTLLLLVFIVILGLGFTAPAVMEEYSREAAVFDPTNLSIESITSTGVRARVQGDFKLDGARVHKKPVRDLGRAMSWVAKAIESREITVEVYLPEHGDVLLGTAIIPPVVISIRDGVTTHVDFVSDLSAGDLEGLKDVAQDWIKGSISSLHIRGDALVPLKSGIFYLGTHTLSDSIIFGQNDLPTLPQYKISRLNFHESDVPNGKVMQADASISVGNELPISVTIPPLAFKVMVPGCHPDQPHIHLADANTKSVDVQSKNDLTVEVYGLIQKLPDTLTSICPTLLKSPLDILLGDYMSGDDMTVYISGSENTPDDTPLWISNFLKDITIPVDFHGKTFDNLIRNFSLADVHFGLPDPFSGPNSPDSKPRVSATIKALISLPDEMNFSLNVSQVKANADIYYHDKKLGKLDLHEWQKAKSKRIEAHGDQRAGLAISSIVKDAPIDITDNSVFADIVQKVVFGGKKVVLGVKAAVDVETTTVLGRLTVRDIPAEGEVFVNPFEANTTAFSPKVGNLQLLSTGQSFIKLSAEANFTNPTPYSATIPYFSIKLLSNGTELGYAYSTNATVKPGDNHNVLIEAIWQPHGKVGAAQGREFLSQYISGYNVSLTLQTHAGTLPSQPALGLALSQFRINIPAPSLHTPTKPSKPGEDRDPRAPTFIDDAIFHLLTSTATFTLHSPLPRSSIWVTYLNATAFYNLTDPIGTILYDLPWEIPAGISTSPALPVDWSLDSVGYDAIKDAVGGRLKLAAKADATIRVQNWKQSLWMEGRGIGAHIRF